MRRGEPLSGMNAGCAVELYARYRREPSSVDPETRRILESNPELLERLERESEAPPPAPEREGELPARTAPTIALSEECTYALAYADLARAIRQRGHLAAQLDPLGRLPRGDPELDPAAHGLNDGILEQLPAAPIGGPACERARNAREAVEILRQIYCGTTGYDFEHVHNPDERSWLRDGAESRRFQPRLDREFARRSLGRLSQTEAFEQFLHRSFPGQKRFSVEGTDMLVPMLDESIHCQTLRGHREVLLGMAHRGRLAVLAHVLQKPLSSIIAEFEHAPTRAGVAASEAEQEGWTGDVKHHLGAHSHAGAGSTVQVSITLAPNPSHLEFVNPVVEGMTRAAQERRDRGGSARHDVDAALAILIHGDGAFPAEGIVAETLNLSRLKGFQTGGTIHIIVNNQIGFTTTPAEGRSTTYASDLAKGFEIPIVHVNADDPLACLAACRMACAYRAYFHKDFLIDLVGYRRWGHNEGDEPAFTQPVVYQEIRRHPTVRQIWASEMERLGLVAPEDSRALLENAFHRLQDARKEAREQGGSEPPREPVPCGDLGSVLPRHALPAVSLEMLQSYNESLLAAPEGFSINTRLKRVMERRLAALGSGGAAGTPNSAADSTADSKADSKADTAADTAADRHAESNPECPGIDWAHAESLSFASVLAAGIPIRLTGEDVERGTFSQRHLAFYDSQAGQRWVPLQTLPDARASFMVYNSPLSENAVMGFEYGYSVHSPTVLVLWEAQFGDFANAGQVMIDQFAASARVKWQQDPGLVLLLPHGNEGQGPEHSSARLERFLQLAADDNIRIVNCSTSAQYFHLLRDHAALLACAPRPLVVMSPKSLLRLPEAGSTAEELTGGRFQPVIWRRGTRPESVRRLILCSGKVYYDLLRKSRGAFPEWLAVARIEELYPFPGEEIRQGTAAFPDLDDVVWLQEEPRNMGAWGYMLERLPELIRRPSEGGLRDLPLRYVGRQARSSPAEGSAELHAAIQSALIEEALKEPALACCSAPVEAAGGDHENRVGA